MQKKLFNAMSKFWLFRFGAAGLTLTIGVLLGMFVSYATGTEHRAESKPIKVDYCFLFSHEDLFRGQQVETDAHYMLGIEGAGIEKEECPEYAAVFSGPAEDDPLTREWKKDINKQWFPAEFDISFVGIIPTFPRYKEWSSRAKVHWQPMHHVPSIQIIRLTHFQRTR